MGHSIQYYKFNEGVSKDVIKATVDEDAIYESDTRKPIPHQIRYLEREIYESEEKAHQAIEDNDDGWYDQIAVKYYKYTEGKETKTIKDIKERLSKSLESLNCYRSENLIKNRKSKFVGCGNCGSRVNKEYIGDKRFNWNRCPLCNEDLSSKTVVKSIETKENNILKLQERLDKEVVKNNMRNKPKVKWLVKTEFHV